MSAVVQNNQKAQFSRETELSFEPADYGLFTADAEDSRTQVGWQVEVRPGT